jgi:YjjG family noncanonical pyrimidine nucleotidase
MKHYDWLLFDLDNTLLDFNASSRVAFFSIFPELVDGDYVLYREFNHAVWVAFENGHITKEVLKLKRWSDFFEAKGMDADPRQVNDQYFEHIKMHPLYIEGAFQLIKDLLETYRLCIITNGLSEVQTSRLELSGINSLIEHIVISDTIGVAKPEEAFFDHTFELIGRPMREDVLVIGDTLTSDIRGGIEYGTDTCWYNYYKGENETTYRPTYVVKDIQELRRLLLR